jgi:hypothetical protein
MKKGLGLAFLVLAVIHCGASAPGQTDTGNTVGNAKKPTSNKNSVSPQGFAADQILKFFGGKKDKKAVADKKSAGQAKAALPAGENASEMLKLPPKLATSSVPVIAKVPAFAVPNVSPLSQDTKSVGSSVPSKSSMGAETKKIKQMVVPPPPVPRMALPQIRQEIQKILALNKQIKSVQSGRAGQFQQIQEQARMHQKILNDLELAKQGERDRKVPTRADLLAQEKLRIIHEETQRNADLLETAGRENAMASGQKTASSDAELVSTPKSKKS